MSNIRILLLDVENSPHLGWYWDPKVDYIPHNMMVQERELLCFGAKWYQDPHTYWYKGEDIIPAAHEMMSEADAIITYNGLQHDIPLLNQGMILAGLTPPAPSKQIDLYQTVKRHFKFYSNSLAYVLKALGLPEKSDSGGMQTWLDCMNPNSVNHKQAWADMEQYNRDDVEIMEPLYDRLRPWITNHPNINLYAGEEWVCPACGSDDLTKQGFNYTGLTKRQQYKCMACGRWSTDGRRIAGARIR